MPHHALGSHRGQKGPENPQAWEGAVPSNSDSCALEMPWHLLFPSLLFSSFNFRRCPGESASDKISFLCEFQPLFLVTQ